MDERSAFHGVADHQPRLWSLNRWISLRRDRFGETCFLIDSGTDPQLYEFFEFEYRLVELSRDSLFWDALADRDPDCVNNFRLQQNLIHHGWCLPWSLAWLRGLCQSRIVGLAVRSDFLMYSELDLIVRWSSDRGLSMLDEESAIACPTCRYGIETSLMLFRLSEFDRHPIERLSKRCRSCPEDHVSALLHPQILALRGDRDEINTAGERDVSLETTDRLTQSSAERMQRFHEIAPQSTAR